MSNRLLTALCLWFALGLSLAAPGAAAPQDKALLREGNKLYRAKNYAGALEHYRKAEEKTPDAPLTSYNIGNALHQQEQYDEAIDSFRKVYQRNRPELFDAAQYNLGCSLYRRGERRAAQQQLEPAVEDLRQALKTFRDGLRDNPGDQDLKYNHEQTRRKLREIEELLQEQQQQQQQDQQNDDEQDQNQQDQQNQDQQQDQQQEQDQQQDEQNQDQQNQDQQQDQQQQDQQNQAQAEQESIEELSKEMVRQILSAMYGEQDPEKQKRIFQPRSRGVRFVRDW